MTPGSNVITFSDMPENDYMVLGRWSQDPRLENLGCIMTGQWEEDIIFEL